MNQNNGVTPEMEQLSLQIGNFIQYWGFKKIHGQIWSHLYLSAEPLDAGELIRRLNVSKALISMSISELLEYDVILERGKGPRNTLVYVANPDVTSVILNVLRRREKQILAQVESAHRLVEFLSDQEKKDSGMSKERISRLGELIHQAQGGLAALLSLCMLDLNFWSKIKNENQK